MHGYETIPAQDFVVTKPLKHEIQQRFHAVTVYESCTPSLGKLLELDLGIDNILIDCSDIITSKNTLLV